MPKSESIVKAIFPFSENKDVLDKVATNYPIYAYPEHDIILFDGHMLDLQEVSALLYDRAAG